MSTGDSIDRRKVLASAAALLVSCGSRAFATARGAGPPVVRTANGPVGGRTTADRIHVFKGLRYAAPPVGAFRFRPPQPLARWTEVADAVTFGNAALQGAGQPDMPTDESHGEDCLFLNVWTAGLDNRRRPVMVWLHGGGYESGAASRPTYWGDQFAGSGVVLVSVNHRLNVFGYLQLPEAWGPEYESSGIAGLLDIVAALRWVRANIAPFGGNPDNVTLFGESGGGAKVSMLMAMPAASGLYHKAIIQSGAVLEATPRDYAQALGGAVTAVLGIEPGDQAALTGVDARKLFDCQAEAMARVRGLAPEGFLNSGFAPCNHPTELPRLTVSADPPPMTATIPLLIGTNKDEGTLFGLSDPAVMAETEAGFETRVRRAFPDQAGQVAEAIRQAYPGYSPPYLSMALFGLRMFWVNAIRFAERKLRQPARVWMYRMDWESPVRGGALKATHAMELSFVFGTFDHVRSFVGPGDGPGRMAGQMHPAWVAFARSGNPRHSRIPEWPSYTAESRATMIFNLESQVVNDPWRTMRQLIVPDVS